MVRIKPKSPNHRRYTSFPTISATTIWQYHHLYEADIAFGVVGIVEQTMGRAHG